MRIRMEKTVYKYRCELEKGVQSSMEKMHRHDDIQLQILHETEQHWKKSMLLLLLFVV